MLEDVVFIHRPSHLLRSLFGHYVSGKSEHIINCRGVLSFIQHHFCSLRILDRHAAFSLHSATILCSSSDNYFTCFQGFELAFTQVLEDVVFIYRPSHLLRSLFGHYVSSKGEDIVHSRVVLSFIQHHFCSLRILDRHAAFSLHSATILRSSSDNYFTCFQSFELAFTQVLEDVGFIYRPSHLLYCLFGHYVSGKSEHIVYRRGVLRFIQYYLCSLGNFRLLFFDRHSAHSFYSASILCGSCDGEFPSFERFELTIANHI